MDLHVLDNRCPTCVIAGEQVAHALRQEAVALTRAMFCREMAIVALRMLARAGKLKPTTDDERAAVELAGYQLNLPAADRRLAHPGTPPMPRDEYVDGVIRDGHAVLFDVSTVTSPGKKGQS